MDTQSFLSIAVLHILALGSLGPTGLSSATIKGHAESLLKILCQLPHPSGLVLRTPSGPPPQLPSPCPVSCWVPGDPLPPPLAPTPLIRMLFLNSRAHLSLYCSPPCCGSRCYEENFGTLSLALSAPSLGTPGSSATPVPASWNHTRLFHAFIILSLKQPSVLPRSVQPDPPPKLHFSLPLAGSLPCLPHPSQISLLAELALGLLGKGRAGRS